MTTAILKRGLCICNQIKKWDILLCFLSLMSSEADGTEKLQDRLVSVGRPDALSSDLGNFEIKSTGPTGSWEC